MLTQLTPEQMFDILALSVNGPRAWDLDLAVDVTFADPRRQLSPDPAQRGPGVPEASARAGHGGGDGHPWPPRCGCWPPRWATSTRLASTWLATPGVLQTLMGVLDRPDPNFNIITP